MADTKISALTAAAAAALANEHVINEAGTSKKVTQQQILDAMALLAGAGLPVADADILAIAQSSVAKSLTALQLVGKVGVVRNASTTGVAGGFSADTYIAGAQCAIPAGYLPLVGTSYYCAFDMVKTGAGTATPIITARYGINGSAVDAAILTFTFAVGTGVIDTGIIEVWLSFRSVGGGTSAVLAGKARITHHLAATGLTTTGASGTGIIIPAASSGFNSAVANSILGVSFNGGASFSGTLVEAQARLRL
jgi:hypothetical protein